MKPITLDYLTRAEIWLMITILIYFLMNGAQIFETFIFVPKWLIDAPDNFKILRDTPGASLKYFWIIFHSIHEITFILAIIFCWKIGPVRNTLLVLFAFHFGVRVWTLAYFAPNIIDFQNIADGAATNSNLIKRTEQWKNLNYIRVGIFIAVSFCLIPLLHKVSDLKFNLFGT